ncbi:MAG TPA: malonate transporter subunit MadM [SAR86 cluster bacterium]|nr:malonate transporter subunit MadM [SAR86 cluster bacterium]HJM59693.1 malonate transporter subunit MadM [SAR86 cluster bacterium]|tara:strand:+ start:8220 stop:8990 length:771 start_codon:yes stop_codon:yes gene_type:complete
MMDLLEVINSVLSKNGLITSFIFVGCIVWVSYFISDKLTDGKFHGSALAILLGLLFAYLGGTYTGGEQGVADISFLSGVGLLGGAMLRDFAIVATAYGVRFEDLKSSGLAGVLSLFIGVILSFFAGAAVAVIFGYSDATSITTIGAGAVTFVVGPVTGSALGASSDVIALSIAAGLVKSILVMVGTPFLAKHVGLNNPKSAMIFGGLMGTNSGVAAGLAAVDPKLVPYGAMTATFYTGLGCLLAPSFLYLIINIIY